MGLEEQRARRALEAVNIEIIRAASGRRAGVDRGLGKRPPAALGGAPVELVTLSRVVPGRDAPEQVTAPGHKTARRALPHLLAGLGELDPRRVVAMRLEGAAAAVGSVGAGADLAARGGGGVLSAAFSDGGAVAAVTAARRLRELAVAANGWRSDAPAKQPERVALPVVRRRGNAQQINAWPAVWGLCVDGAEVSEILRRHGWATTGRNVRALAGALLAILDDMAAADGLGRAAVVDAKTGRR